MGKKQNPDGFVKAASSRTIPLFFILFFFSGMAGLIYESIWSHYLKLFLGHAAYAQTLVLVIYMGGMAVGSWVASRYSNRIKNLLLFYAAAEIIIGLTALVFHPIYVHYLSFAYDTMFPSFNSAFMASVIKWTSAPLLILPQTILLGATFPLMAGGIVRLGTTAPGRVISILYFVNSLGGALGVLLSGFYLIGKLAFPGTVRFAGLLDIVVGGGVFALLLFMRKNASSVKKAQEQTSFTPKSSAPDSGARALLLVAALTAASSFIYEVGWIRMLSLVLGSSTHSFELMLSAFILGLALGGYVIRNRLDSMKSPMTSLAVIQVAMGACAILSLVFYSKLFVLMKFFMNALARTDQGFVMFHVYSHFICLVLMLPATILAGMTLPIITWYLFKKNSDEAAIGRVYAFNTVGSIAGVLVALHALMPFVGLKYLLIIGGAVDMLIGLYLLRRFTENTGKRLTATLAAVTVLAIAVPAVSVRLDPALLSSGVYRTGKTSDDSHVVFHKDGKTSSVTLCRGTDYFALKNNGKTDASLSIDAGKATPDERTQLLLAAYPLSYSRACRSVGLIGLGSGMTASTLLESDSVERLDVVEIEPFVVEAARLIGPKVGKVFSDKRSAIHVDDAKTFFSAHRKKYDIIISEPSNPWISGISSLFSMEFFSRIEKHLTPGGMLVQWLHLYEMSPDLIASILMSIGKTFQDYKAFVSGTDIIILASQSQIPDDPSDRALGNPRIGAALRAMSIEHGYDFQSNHIGGKRFLSCLAGIFDIPLNSDYNPVLDLNAVKARILNSNSEEYATMKRFIIPVRKYIEGDTTAFPHEPTNREIPHGDHQTAYIRADYEAWQAWFCISNRGTEKAAFADSAISRPVAMTIAHVRMAARDPSIAARQLWPKYAIDLLKITMPYLPKAQMKDIWAYIDEEGGKIAIREKSRDMLAVLRGITFENWESARSLSGRMLGKGRIVDEEHNRMLAAAYLVASVNLNSLDGIPDLWNNMGSMRYDFNLMTLYNYSNTLKPSGR